MAELAEIKKEIKDIVKVISSIIRTEVVLFTESYKIIAGTGKYKNMANSQYPYKNVLEKVIKYRETEIIKNPGYHEYCRDCKKNKNCQELMGVFSPICLDGKLLGIIKLETYEKERKEFLLKYEEEVMKFLEQIGELIKNKLIDQMVNKKSKNLFDQLQALMNSLESGIIATDEKGVITNFNKAAENLLDTKRSKVVGNHINNIFPNSDIIEVLDSGIKIKNKEIAYEFNNYSKKVIISANPIKNNFNTIGIVVSVKGIKDLRKLLDDFNLKNYNLQFEEIVGKSKALKNAQEKVLKVAKSNSSILIKGESGTGKELFAKAIHKESLRSDENFVSINCAAIPGDLLESELFGYEAGAFTGAKKEGKPGKLELADKGTVFLDEIGDMPITLQAKILKVIQEKTFFRIGGVKEINVDIRIISATNKNLENLIKEGKFREDLYYRLNVIPLNLPPLRDRKNDILILVKHFIKKYNKELDKNIKDISQEASKSLLKYKWPGNVRELENVIEYAVNMENSPYIKKENLPPYIIKNKVNSKNKKSVNLEDDNYNLNTAIKKVEKELIKEALDDFGRDTEGKYKAAEKLGIGKTTLYNKINKYNIK